MAVSFFIKFSPVRPQSPPSPCRSLGFLRKVYGILSAQLVMTTLVAALFMSSETVKGFVQGSPNILFSAMILSFVMMIALFVKRRDTPANYILLGLFVSWMVHRRCG